MQRVPESVSLTACASVRTVRFLVTHHRPQIGEKRAAARAALDVQVKGADAFGLGDIHVVEVRHPVGPAGVDERG